MFVTGIPRFPIMVAAEQMQEPTAFLSGWWSGCPEEGWLDGTVIHPCLRAMVLSSLHCLAWVALVLTLGRFAVCGTRARRTTTNVKSANFAAVQAATLLLSLVHTLAAAWICVSCYRHSRCQLHRLLLPLTQALVWATSLLLLAYEEKYGLAHHFPVLRTWWGLCGLTCSIHALCDIAGDSKARTMDLFITAGTALMCLALLLATPRGATGLVIVMEDDQRQKPLLAGGGSSGSSTAEVRGITPYARAGYVSKVLFLWVEPLLKTGSRKTLQVNDVPALPMEAKADTLFDAFHLSWDGEGNHSVASALARSRCWPLALTGLLYLLKVSVMYVGPLMIQRFIDFAAQPSRHWIQGVRLVLLLLVAKMVEEVTERQRNFGTRRLSLSVRSSLVAAVFRKSLRLSNSARHEHGTGQIVNYMSVDVEEISNFVMSLHNLWVMPIQIVIALVILFRVVGVSMLAGLGSMIALMACCLLISSKQREYWKKIMACKDARIKATNEAITNMKIIKMQAWQEWFLRLVERTRDNEQFWAARLMYVAATSIFFLWLSPLAVSVATFGMCVLVGKELTAGRVFTAIATFRILQEPLRAFPSVVMAGSQAATALSRLKRYFESDEIDVLSVDRGPVCVDDTAVLLENASFKWTPDADTPVLEGLDVRVKGGSLVTVVGTVGSGKSSLLACILGEMHKVSGAVRVNGQSAYVAQSPWIQNGTIRDNILFGKELDIQRYRQTLQVCCLHADLGQFVAGDMTVIGERGFNLSGGQKQRIQLARAVYQDADVYLLDDIFSAVDAHTGTALFMDCVRGALSSKTVILVTHQIEFLHGADLILMMKQGRIVQSGKFDELLAQGVHFADLVQAHHQALQSVDIQSGSATNTVVSPSEGLQQQINHSMHLNASPSQQDEDTDEEERARGRVGGRVYWAYITQAFRGLHVVVFFLIQSAWQGLQIASDFWLAYSTSDKNRPLFHPRQFILVYSLLAIGSGIFVLMRSMLISYCGLIMAQKLYLSMLRSIFRAPISFFDATPTGRILTRSSTDQVVVDFTLPFLYGSSLANGFQLIGVFIVTSEVTWQLVLVLLPLAWIYFRYQSYFITTSRELTRLKSVTDAPVIHHFKETIAGLMTIRAFGHEQRFARVNSERIDTNVCMSFHNGAANDWLSFRLETIGIVILCFSALFLVLLPKSFINPEFIGLSLSYGLALSGCLNYMIFYICQIEQNMVAVERILQYSSIDTEEQVVTRGAPPGIAWPETGSVAVQSLQLRYRAGLPLVLRDVTFIVEGGEKLGVVGRTGSGKSSFIQALFRLVEPVHGTIVIDNIDIQNISLNLLRSKLSIIPQEPTMFEGTVRSNIDPLSIYEDDEIWEALEKCQLAETVKQLKLKLEAPVGENGENWSMGQRQLFCLGRVMLKRSRILVLDEATASIDTHTDWILQRIIKEEFSGRTVISIAHRIPSVMDSDKVLVLDNGRSREFASPSALLSRRDSLFAGLVHEYWSRSKSAQNLAAVQ